MPVAEAGFQGIRDIVLATVDAKLSEPVRLSFMKDGRTDPAREQVVIEAMLRTGEGKDTSAGAGSGASWRTRLQAGKAELHIDMKKYPDLPKIEGKDRVRAIARRGQPLFEVLGIDDRGHTRLVLQLGEK